LQPRLDFIDNWRKLALGNFQIVSNLCTSPVTFGKAKKSTQTQIGIGGNLALAGNHFTDALCGRVNLPGQPILTQAHRSEIFLL
jgi:hypothetical protein